MFALGTFEIYALVAAVLLLLLLTLLAWHLVNRSCVQTVEQLLEPEKVLEKIGAIDDAVFLAAESVLNEWTELKRFEHAGYFLCHTLTDGAAIKCAAWWSEKRRSYLMLYVAAKKVHYEFVSVYPDAALVTSSGKHSFVLPFPPESHVQVFTRGNIDALLAAHKKGQKTLKNRRNLTPQNALPENLYATMITIMARQAQYVQSIPLWKWKGAYWFFIRKHLLANRPVRG